VVDDRPDVRTLLRKILERVGHEVSEAPGGRNALAQAERNPVDIVITDMHMPEGDGLELTRGLQKLEYPPAIVAMSGNDVAMTFRMARLLGARAILPKPFTIADVLAAVEQVTDTDDTADDR
jgi:CheY-like chemotaxis protein